MPICRCVSGIVVEEGAATPQAGLRVRLVTEKGRGSVALAEATTDKGGRFSIEVSGLSADARPPAAHPQRGGRPPWLALG